MLQWCSLGSARWRRVSSGWEHSGHQLQVSASLKHCAGVRGKSGCALSTLVAFQLLCLASARPQLQKPALEHVWQQQQPGIDTPRCANVVSIFSTVPRITDSCCWVRSVLSSACCHCFPVATLQPASHPLPQCHHWRQPYLLPHSCGSALPGSSTMIL